MGTPQFMSPEQAEARTDELDERTDIFALGGILYSMLTLHPPVDGTTVEEVLAKVRRGDITPPAALNGCQTSRKPADRTVPPSQLTILPATPARHLPPALSAVAMKAMAFHPSNRYPTIAALSADISAYLGGFATKAESASLLARFRLLINRQQPLSAGSLFGRLTFGFLAGNYVGGPLAQKDYRRTVLKPCLAGDVAAPLSMRPRLMSDALCSPTP